MNGAIYFSRGNPYNLPTKPEETIDIHEASVTWDYSTSEYSMTRDPYTKSFNFNSATTTYSGRSSFDLISPWKDIKTCLLSPNGEVIAYEGEPEFSRTPSEGDVMIEIPKFWYGIKIEPSSSRITITISDREKEGLYVSPRHQKWGNITKDYDNIYIAAYRSTANGRSLSGADSFTSSTAFNTWIERHKKSGYTQFDYLTLMTVELLRLVETADFSINSLQDYSDQFGSSKTVTGLTDQIQFHSGYLRDSSWKYRGMENLADSTCGHGVFGIGVKNNYFYTAHDSSLVTTSIPADSFEYRLSFTSSSVNNKWVSTNFRYDESKEYQDWTALVPYEFVSEDQTHQPFGINTVDNGTQFIGSTLWEIVLFGCNMPDANSSLLTMQSATVTSSGYFDTISKEKIHTRLLYLPPEK